MAFLDALALRLGRRLPLVLQTEATECGLACLAMIAGYHGHHTGLMELRRRFSVSLKGISLKQLIQTAHRLGLGTRAVKLDLGDLGKLKLPCVLHWNFNHFVVLKAVDGRGAVLHDPAHGQRRLGLEEVSRSFTGVALELWPESGFEKQEAPPRIKLLGMLGKVTGLYRSLAQVLLLAGALEVFSLISPFFLQWTIDNVIVSEDRDLLSTLAIGFGLLLLMQQAVSGVRAWVMMHMSTLLGVQWQANVFSHLLRLPAQYFEKRHLGDVVSRFGAVNSIQQTLTAAFLSAVLDGLMTVATLGMMLLYSPPLAAIAIAAMSLYALGRWIWYRPLRNATEEQIVHAARQQSHFLETVRGIRPLKLFQRQDERRSVWLGLLVEQINAGLRTQKLQLFYQQLNGLLFGVENLLVIWLGATMVMDGQFSVGILMAFNAYKSQFDSRVGSLIDKFFELRMLQLQGERLADIVLQAPEVSHGDILPENLREREASIEIQGLRYRYAEQEPWVLDGLDLRIAGGESVAIVGPSGCGKSTLFNVLLGILPPVEGQIRMAGLDLAQLGLDGLRELVGTVLQDDVLFAGSLSDNISFFDPQPDMPWLLQCAQMAAIHDDIQAMPMGYNTLVGDMGTVLSGGQKQRVMLARALYKKPRILFLDEATSHLDVHCEQRVNAAIRALRITRIMVAHRPETIASADRVIVLGQGKVSLDESTARLAERQAAAARSRPDACPRRPVVRPARPGSRRRRLRAGRVRHRRPGRRPGGLRPRRQRFALPRRAATDRAEPGGSHRADPLPRPTDPPRLGQCQGPGGPGRDRQVRLPAAPGRPSRRQSRLQRHGLSRCPYLSGDGHRHRRGASLQLSWVLFDFGRRSAALRNAQQLLLAANASQDATLQNTFALAAQAYYDALAAQRSLAASRQVAELAAQNLEAADAKYRAGAAALSDRLQAQTALSQASLAQVRDEGALSNALGVIALRMGLAPDTPLRLSGELEAQPDTGFVKAIDEMLAEARREHPALLAAQARLKPPPPRWRKAAPPAGRAWR